MKLLLYIILLCTTSCKKNERSQSVNKVTNIELTDSLICSVNYKENQIYLKYDNTNKVLNIEELNFIMNELSDVKIDCVNDKIIIKYYEKIGNQYIQTSHILDKKDNKLLLSKIYRFESSRNGVNLFGAILENEINDYTGVEPNVKTVNIYSFSGFKEELTPTINEYFDNITFLFKNKNYEELSLWADTLVVSHIIDIVAINESNVSMYNDIAYYLEQSKACGAAIFLLKKIIVKFPNRLVAYINLGDAYWSIGDNKKAKNAYKKYFELMKSKEKESKIPKRVFDRL
ncbi:hypothetical protein A8C32_03695 [Flavivirga aquatica]|uniref:Uncharacterized protein n=1 Tax=Flavivirga aquatica TaxID=1849968 RepID=A0A1E5TB06_9FLAO|nr:hypothetical protein [Flavivirga aquatica]OEK08564.1 hypothetical protein A8C32_03695 [Flavivirga aquatica]